MIQFRYGIWSSSNEFQLHEAGDETALSSENYRGKQSFARRHAKTVKYMKANAATDNLRASAFYNGKAKTMSVVGAGH